MNWEKEFDKIPAFIIQDWEQPILSVAGNFIRKKDAVAFISEVRKELLDEVREKVIGKKRVLSNSRFYNDLYINENRKRQLKKLKELEEGK